MSLSKFGRSWRGRVSFAASILLLTGALIAVPQLSNAASNAVKQFKASISPPTGTVPPWMWMETVTNCGPTSTSPCNASSTIAIGTIQIAIPSQLQPATVVSVATPSGQTVRNWDASYVSTGNINAFAHTGSDKLQPGESLVITFSTPSSCSTSTTFAFTTSAWGSNSLPGTNSFAITGSQPTVACLGPGGSATGPQGTTITAGDDFTGTVGVTFGGGLDCSTFLSGPGHGDGDQWRKYHLPDEVNVVGGVKVKDWKSYTFTFPATIGVDSSWYLICYGSVDPWTGSQGTQTIDGTTLNTGILSKCSYYDSTAGTRTSVAVAASVPCVSDQNLSLDGKTISITVRDPLATKFH
jgi:hypothetical protein